MDLVQFIVIGLATWRVVNFVYDDRWEGPFSFLMHLRHAIGIRYDTRRVGERLWLSLYGKENLLLCTIVLIACLSGTD
jgi:hypothetical protein